MMKRLSLSTLILLSCAVGISSCAYMQTNKSVAELGCLYEGKVVTNQDCSTWNIYKSRGEWYIGARQVDLKKKYPIVRDTVLYTENNEPTFELKSEPKLGKYVYHRISEGTAQVLMRKDGYAHLGNLAEEIRSTPGEWVESLDKPRSYPIRAHVEQAKDMQESIIAGERTPQKTPAFNQVLRGVDFVLVDIPGTLVYNLAIPIMAPIRFFSEFTVSY